MNHFRTIKNDSRSIKNIANLSRGILLLEDVEENFRGLDTKFAKPAIVIDMWGENISSYSNAIQKSGRGGRGNFLEQINFFVLL
jgi:hypothetical protein